MPRDAPKTPRGGASSLYTGQSYLRSQDEEAAGTQTTRESLRSIVKIAKRLLDQDSSDDALEASHFCDGLDAGGEKEEKEKTLVCSAVEPNRKNRWEILHSGPGDG